MLAASTARPDGVPPRLAGFRGGAEHFQEVLSRNRGVLLLGDARPKSEAQRSRGAVRLQEEAFRHPHEVQEPEEERAERPGKQAASTFVPSSVARGGKRDLEPVAASKPTTRQRHGSVSSMGSGVSAGSAWRKERVARATAAEDTTALVDSPGFVKFFAACVLVNICTIGVATDYDQLAPQVFEVTNTAFLLVYFTESFLRLMTFGVRGLHDRLTVMDLLLNMAAFAETILSAEQAYARALPALRLLRVGRYMRSSPFFAEQKELWLMSAAIGNAMYSLVWVAMILGLFVLSFAVLAQDIVGESAVWIGRNDPLAEGVEAFESFDNHEYFGSVSRSMLSLIQIVTLSEWADHIARQVTLVYPTAFFFFACFIFATAYGLVMCVVSNVVLSSMTSSKSLDSARKQLEMQHRKEVAAEAMEIFAFGDADGDGKLTLEELEEEMQKPALPRILESLDVPVLDAENLILMFDLTGDGTIDYEELVRGCAGMNEDITPQDYTKLNLRAWSMVQRAKRLEALFCSSLLLATMGYATRMIEVALLALQNYEATRTRSLLKKDAIDPPGWACWRSPRAATRRAAAELLRAVPKIRQEGDHQEALVVRPSQSDADAFLGFAARFCGRPPRQPAGGGRPSSAPEELDDLQRAAVTAAPRPLPGFGEPPPDEPAKLRGAGVGERPPVVQAGAGGIRPLPDVSVMMSQICGKAVLCAPPAAGRRAPPAGQARGGRAEDRWDRLDVYRGKVDAVSEIRHMLP
ncbi:unnamed protein product [Prorocentrum cordatum]|uniref:EF-hand domain-containing protein n=2 Tax=Prorocentrum cordatum TaxID=2364126 RepID=A0ABN9YI40_9DINO|nr:unnamed protein product [Polarella glacialis]